MGTVPYGAASVCRVRCTVYGPQRAKERKNALFLLVLSTKRALASVVVCVFSGVCVWVRGPCTCVAIIVRSTKKGRDAFSGLENNACAPQNEHI